MNEESSGTSTTCGSLWHRHSFHPKSKSKKEAYHSPLYPWSGPRALLVDRQSAHLCIVTMGNKNQRALTKYLTFVVNSKGWHQIEAINLIESQSKSCQQPLLKILCVCFCTAWLEIYLGHSGYLWFKCLATCFCPL